MVTLEDFLTIARQRGIPLVERTIGGFSVLVREDRRSRPVLVPRSGRSTHPLERSTIEYLCQVFGLDVVDFHLDPPA